MKIEKILLILIVIFALSRLLFLDADSLIGNLEDEGYWSYNARNKVLFGQWITDDYTISMAAAPLYAFFSFLVFKIFGVHLFSARLVNALSGILSIFLLYFIIKKYNKRLAILAAFLLALDNAFFMYNRIGYPESLVIFFLLLNFFFLTSKSKYCLNYLFAGASFMLAILSKLSAVYFSVAIFSYLAMLLIRKEISLREIFVYFTGFLLIGIIILIFYYIPLFPKLEVNLKVLPQLNLPLILIPLSLFRFTTIPYFSLPSIFLLLILSMIYFKKRQIFTFFLNLRQNIKLLNQIELIAFSWFFGYSIGLLFSDFNDRRFPLFIIPLILFTTLLFERKEKPFSGKESMNLFIFFILLIPVLNLFSQICTVLLRMDSLKSILKLTLSSPIFSKIESLGYDPLYVLSIISLFPFFLLSAIILYKISPRYKTIYKYLLSISLLCLISVISSNFIYKNNSRIIKFLYLSIPNLLIALIALLFSIILFVSLRKYPILLKRVVFSLYIIFCFSAIIYTLFFPTFSVRNASNKMAKITKGGDWIIGRLGHTLSLENKLRPLLWIPNCEIYKYMNNKETMEKYKPKYYLRNKYEKDATWPTPEQIGKPLTYLETFELWSISKKTRVIIELYEINY